MLLFPVPSEANLVDLVVLQSVGDELMRSLPSVDLRGEKRSLLASFEADVASTDWCPCMPACARLHAATVHALFSQ